MVTRVDRLARSIKDLQDIVHELRARGVTLKATEQPIDTATSAGKAFLDMLGVFAEFETNLRREGFDVRDEDVARLSPLVHEHINMLGRYAFTLPELVARGELRPLRSPVALVDEDA